MNLRWLFGNFTDPQYKLSLRDQVRLSNEAHSRYVSNRAVFLRTVLILIPFLVAFMLLEPLLATLGYAGQSGPYGIAILILIAVFWPWSAWMYRSLYIRPFRHVMRDAGYDLCLGCGYELRGLDDATARCPECGELRPTSGDHRDDADDQR